MTRTEPQPSLEQEPAPAPAGVHPAGLVTIAAPSADRGRRALPTWSIETASTLADMRRFRAFHERHAWHPESDPHLMSAALEELAPERRPWLLQASRDGETVALLVGQVADVRMPWCVGYTVLHESSFRQLEVLHGGFLGETSGAVAHRLFDEVALYLRRGGADAALLRYVPEGSTVQRVFRARSGWALRDHLTPPILHWRLRLPRTFAAYLQQLSKKSREDCKRFGNRIRKDFGAAIEVTQFERPEHVDDALRIVERIACTTYQRGLRAGFHDTVETRARWRAAANRGWLRVYVLSLGGSPAAFCTGYEMGETLWLEHVGYDPAFRRYRPGGYVLERVVERACNGGRLRVIDFGVGDAEYKRRLCNESAREVAMYVFAPTAKGLWLAALRFGTAAASRCADAVARRLGVLERIKGWWRRRIARRGGRRGTPPAD